MATKIGTRLPADFITLQRRRRILDAFSELVASESYSGATIAQIVKKARIARKTFYDTFTGKEAAARALVADTYPSFLVDPDDLERSALAVLAVEAAARLHIGDEGYAQGCADALGAVAGSITLDGTPKDDALLCSLPAGRHGLPDDFVWQNQEHRIFTALASQIVEHGYPRTTIGHICERACVSRRTFYEHFDGIGGATVALASSVSVTIAPDLQWGLGMVAAEVIAAAVFEGPTAARTKTDQARRLLVASAESEVARAA